MRMKIFSDTLRVSSESKGNIQSKVFSKDAFVAYFEAHQNERGRFEKLRKPVSPQWHAPAAATLPHFVDALMEAESKPLRDLTTVTRTRSPPTNNFP